MWKTTKKVAITPVQLYTKEIVSFWASSTVLNFANGSKVNPGDIIAKWDPLTRPVIAEVAGKAKFIDIEDDEGTHFGDLNWMTVYNNTDTLLITASAGSVVISEPMSGFKSPSRSGDAYFGFYTLAMTSG